MTTRQRRARAFTILEILIAIVVLVLGIMGIIALFPTAIESGNRTVEDSYAAAITQSVVDAITVGLRESRYTVDAPPRGTYTYFVFNHDGVLDQSPQKAGVFTDTTLPTTDLPDSGYIWARDYCVILPKGPAGNKVLANEPVFLYPIPAKPDDLKPGAPLPTSGMLARRNITALSGANFDDLDDLKDAAGKGMRPTVDGNQTAWIRRTYPLGRYRMPEGGPSKLPPRPGAAAGELMLKGEVRLEFRGDTIVTSGGSTTGGEESIAVDPYPTYSFAFALQRARVDTTSDGKIDGADDFSDTLYQLRVMIFKNFDAAAANETDLDAVGGAGAIPRTNVPVKEFVTLLAL